MATSEAGVESIEQDGSSVAAEKTTGDISDSSVAQPTNDTLASNVGSNLVPSTEQEAELANPQDSSNNIELLSDSAVESNPNPLMKLPDTEHGLVDDSADNNSIQSGAHLQPPKSPIFDGLNAVSTVDIQALLNAIPLQTSNHVFAHEQIEKDVSSSTTHPEASNLSVRGIGEPESEQPASPSDPTSLTALMQSSPSANASLSAPIPAPMLSTGSNGLPPPPSASFQHTLPQTISLPSIPGAAVQAKTPTEEDGPFPPDLEGPYEDFLRIERANLNEGNWEKFPDGSRLFIGNLPTEKVSKRDVFKRFCRYGKLAQISLKQAYGFVQFLDSESCARAKEHEQDTSIKGRKIHLEISRPNRGGKDRTARRRSRSPENNTISSNNNNNNNNRNRGDRYAGGGAGTRERDRDYRRNRDDYRPNRSPSPPRGRYRRGQSPDHYDGRRKSRSRSPYRDVRRDERREDEDLPLPHRAPGDVPEVQIIVVDDLSREFIGYVESNIKSRGLRCDVLILSPRLSEEAVIRRQIMEGVLAVIRLSRINQATGKIPVRLFNRSTGAENVNFEDYENLDAQIAAEVIIRAKSTHAPPTPSYPPTGGSPYGVQPSYGAPSAAINAQPDLSALLSQLGSRPDAQSLLTALHGQGQMPNHSAPNLPPGISQQLLATLSNPSAQGYDQSGTSQSHMALASLLGTQPSMQQGMGSVPGSMSQGQNSQNQKPDMQEIMAQLAKYQR